jgi:hypothetical protein
LVFDEGSRGAIKERLFTRHNPEHSPAAKDLVAEYQERTDRALGQLREAFAATRPTRPDPAFRGLA